MYPGTMHWWRSRQRDTHCDAHVGCGPMHRGPWERRHDPWAERHAAPGGPGELGGGFGVRRPLRFLAFKLDLEPEQVAALARILDELKTERAQAEVDGRRAVAAFADAVAADAFDEGVVAASARVRVESAERVQRAVVTALGRLHALLHPEQRARLAYLIRMGALTL